MLASRLALLAVAAFVSTATARAYPTFIGYGYTSCQVCHFNAFGNGPLTDYGRAVGASTISARGPFAGSTSDEDLAQASGFLGKVELPDWFRPAVALRGLYFIKNVQNDADRKMRFIPMQSDLSITLQTPDRKHWASFTAGYLPVREGITANASKERAPVISREHYVCAELREGTRLIAGMTDIPFGIRVPDHTSYARAQTQLTMNDQSHLVTVHHYGETYELGLSALAGNLFQESELRQKGFSLFAEYDVLEKVRVGHSNLYTANAYRSRLMNAVHARIGAGEGSAVLIEAGAVSQKTKTPSSNLRTYFLFENMIRFARGFHVMVVGEYTTADTFKSAPRSLRLGPAIQWFPMNRVEIRSDFQVTRILNSTTVEKDTMDFLMQAHLWF
jgi:hypothetical protein